MVFFSLNYMNAQRVYGEFQCYNGEIKTAVVLKKGKSKGAVYLNLDSKGDQSIIFKTKRQRHDFISFLNTSLTKFKKWKQEAIQNDSKNVVKEIGSAKVGNSLSFNHGSWHFAKGKTTVIAKMVIAKYGHPAYALVIPKRVSDSNEYTNSERRIILFNTEEEVIDLVDLLSDKVIKDFISNTSN